MLGEVSIGVGEGDRSASKLPVEAGWFCSEVLFNRSSVVNDPE